MHEFRFEFTFHALMLLKQVPSHLNNFVQNKKQQFLQGRITRGTAIGSNIKISKNPEIKFRKILGLGFKF